MSAIISILSFVFGTIIGSFLNVVILRYHTGLSVWGGGLAPYPSGARGAGSFCFSCGHKLSACDLVPVFSFLFLGGRCRYCKSKISWQYPIVEILTGLVFLSVVLKFSNLLLFPYIIYSVFYILAFCFLIFISVYDFHHKIIPERPVWIFVILALLGSLFLQVYGANEAISYQLRALLASPLMAAPFFILWAVSRGRWMGLGDAKLALGLGFLLGSSGAITALFLSFILGALVSVFLLIFRGRRFTMKSEIPFGPFLVVASFLVFIFNLNLPNLWLVA